MDNPVQAGLSKHLVAEDSIPVSDGELSGEYQGFLVVSVIYDLLEVVLLLAFKFTHSEVVQDQQIQTLDFLEELEFMAFKPCKLQLVQQSGDRIVFDLVSKPAGAFAKGTREERLSGAGGAADHDRGTVLQVFACRELADGTSGHAAGIAGVQLFQARLLLEAGVPYQSVYPVVAAAVKFALQQQFKAVSEGEFGKLPFYRKGVKA